MILFSTNLVRKPIAALLLALCIFSAAPLLANGSTSILVLGDSISAGYGIPIKSGWVNLLEQHLAERGNFKVINASISGETSEGGLRRLPDLLSKHNPNLVIVELGGNDGLRGYPLDIFRENLDRLTTLSLEAGATVVLAGMQIPPNYGRRYTQAFYQTFQHISEKHDVALIPFLLDGVAGDHTLMQSDGIHPTAKAQPILLQNALPTLEKALELNRKL